MANPKEMTRREFLKTAGRAGLVLGFAGGLGGLLSACEDLRQAPSQSTASTKELDGTTTTAIPTTDAPTGTTKAEVLEKVSVIRIESAEVAAQRFGVPGTYSGDPKNWEINEWGGAHLKDNPTDLISHVLTAGAVVEGWIKPKERDSIYDAITIVAHPSVPELKIQGGTFWDFGSEQDQGFMQVLGQVRAKEKIEQPGVVVLPLCDKLGSNPDLGLSVIRIESAEVAAQRFGVPGTYSGDPKNWEINEWGGAHLKDNPTDLISQINLPDGVVAEGWIKPEKLDSKFDAITIVAHNNVKKVELQGATVWDFGKEQQDQGFMQVLGQVRAKEKIEQPGVVVLPAHDCPIRQSN